MVDSPFHIIYKTRGKAILVHAVTAEKCPTLLLKVICIPQRAHVTRRGINRLASFHQPADSLYFQIGQWEEHVLREEAAVRKGYSAVLKLIAICTLQMEKVGHKIDAAQLHGYCISKWVFNTGERSNVSLIICTYFIIFIMLFVLNKCIAW